MRSRRLRRWAAAILLFGAAGAAAMLLWQALVPTQPTGPLALVEPDAGTEDARTEGVLEVTNECVRLHVPNGDLTLVIWVRGSVAWSETDRVILVTRRDGDESILRDGDRVVLGGSGGAMDALDSAGRWARRPAPGCAADNWWVASEVLVGQS